MKSVEINDRVKLKKVVSDLKLQTFELMLNMNLSTDEYSSFEKKINSANSLEELIAAVNEVCIRYLNTMN